MGLTRRICVRCVIALALAAMLGACGTVAERKRSERDDARAPSRETPRRGGGYYKDDGPGDNPPADMASIPDAVPRDEPLHRFANRPYEVFGKTYVPETGRRAFRQQGLASWYGRRFHGKRTSSGEPYDMYAMTAAHPVLPIPSYARVTSLETGRSVVVRVNDRGPFHPGRVIDLSYTAAYKLGYVDKGSARVMVEAVFESDGTPVAAVQRPEPVMRESASPSARPAADVAPAAAGVYLQLGAFSARDNAESFRTRVMRDAPWLSDGMAVVAGGSLYRLLLGPYRTRRDADPVAERLKSELNFSPVFLVRQ